MGHFGLVDTESKSQLNTDIEKFEIEANSEENTDKMKSMYAKLHKGLYMRLALPFAFFFLVRAFKNMINDDPDDPFGED